MACVLDSKKYSDDMLGFFGGRLDKRLGWRSNMPSRRCSRTARATQYPGNQLDPPATVAEHNARYQAVCGAPER